MHGVLCLVRFLSPGHAGSALVLEANDFSALILEGGTIRSAKPMLCIRRRPTGWIYEFHGAGGVCFARLPVGTPGVCEPQEELYDTVYGFAASPEYGGRTFAAFQGAVDRSDFFLREIRILTRATCQVECPAHFAGMISTNSPQVVC